MKLPNGFGSHRYVYSPIFLDSQDLITFYLSTGSSCHAGGAAVLTLYYNGQLASANGMEATISASWLQVQHVYLILQRSVGFQQWNGDGVAPATPGALRTRIPDAGKRTWFLVMEWTGVPAGYAAGPA